LSLTSRPQTDVILNGRRVGTTPIRNMKLPSGSYLLQLRSSKHGLLKTVKVAVRAGETTKRDVTFGKGKVVVNARPWADVYLNGKKLGTTPIAPQTLWEGVYDLRLINPEIGSERRVRINVKANDTVKVIQEM